MLDDAIRERHGVQCRDAKDSSLSTVTVWEHDDHIMIDSNWHDRKLTAYQARYLAAKFYRLSRRVRQRTEPEA